jgi:hypothetical protein
VLRVTHFDRGSLAPLAATASARNRRRGDFGGPMRFRASGLQGFPASGLWALGLWDFAAFGGPAVDFGASPSGASTLSALFWRGERMLVHFEGGEILRALLRGRRLSGSVFGPN